MPARGRQKTGLARHFRKNPTVAEGQVWAVLRHLPEPRFRKQAPFGPYILDFFAPKWNLCVEIDGPLHDPERDKIRDTWLSERGIRILRYSAEDLNLDALVRDVQRFV